MDMVALVVVAVALVDEAALMLFNLEVLRLLVKVITAVIL